MKLLATPRTAGRSRFLAAAGASIAVVAMVAGCSAGGTPAPSEGAAEVQVPDYYPTDYQALIEASQAEGGTLEIYSNTDQENWAPIFRDFQAAYPWITTVNANNLDSDEVFQRQLAETASGSAAADLLVSNAAQAWANFGEDPSRFLDYESPELEQLPDFAELMPNVYAMSTDPVGITYNSQLMEEAPRGYAHLAELVEADPDTFASRVTTRDVNGSFGFSVTYSLLEARPDLWESMEAILPSARPESSSGSQGEKILAGEYLAGFQISAAPSYPIVENSGGLYGFQFPEDGTVVMPRAIAIAAEAPHPATAKLFIDFLLSEAGQAAVAEGGLTSYRDGVEASDDRHTYQEVADAVGEDQIIFVEYALVSQEDVDAFVTRWDGLLGG